MSSWWRTQWWRIPVIVSPLALAALIVNIPGFPDSMSLALGVLAGGIHGYNLDWAAGKRCVVPTFPRESVLLTKEDWLAFVEKARMNHEAK